MVAAHRSDPATTLEGPGGRAYPRTHDGRHGQAPARRDFANFKARGMSRRQVSAITACQASTWTAGACAKEWREG